MGPLIPFEIITQGWGLIIIFILGLSFGIILEQSGFSSSKKLVGVFYAYDFVVLKVFFTAGITAMVGIFMLNYFGWIDTNIVFINSNFLYSALIGGVIMGFGFLMGGFCPGTSLTAAAIGKIDALIFIAGMFLGIFFFGVFFDGFNKIYSGHYFDRELISDTIGMSQNWFITIMIIVTLIAFGVGTYFENNAPENLQPTNKKYSSYFPEVLMAIVIAITILFIPSQNPKSIKEVDEKQLLAEIIEQDFFISSDELAYNIIKNTGAFKLIDVRSRDEYINYHFPGSINIPIERITEKHFQEELRIKPNKRVLLISNGGVKATKAWQLCRRMNYENIYVLDGGLNAFIYNIFYDNTGDENITDYVDNSKYRFRKEAAGYFLNHN